MNGRDGGGPAFPRPGSTYPGPDGDFAEDGMSLRDYFAGQALVALVGLSPRHAEQLSAPNGRSYEDWMAAEAYALADAMLAARATHADPQADATP